MPTLDAVDYIRKRIASELGVRVPEEIERPRPSEFVYVCRNAGARIDSLRDAPRIDVHCWAQTYRRARQLSDAVSDIMLSLNRNVSSGFLSCVETTRRKDPDPDSNQPRWYASYLVNTFRYN